MSFCAKFRAGRRVFALDAVVFPLLAGLAAVFSAETVGAADYYIDFTGGSDSANGTATNSAWQHCPGDSNAKNQAAAAALSPGDTVHFRGGVRYLGRFTVNWSGAPSQPITYRGDDWGVNRAVLDGTATFTNAWSRCTSASQASGNPYYTNIWTAAAPTDLSFFGSLICSNQFLYIAQDVNSTNPSVLVNPYAWNNYSNAPLDQVTMTNLTDAGYFTQTNASDWDGAYVGMHASANEITYVNVTNYNPATHTIGFYFDQWGHGYTPAYDPTGFSMLNHPRLIDQVGEYAFIGTNIYLWPMGSVDPNTQALRYSVSVNGIQCQYRSNIVVRGLKFDGYSGAMRGFYNGGAVYSLGTRNLTIRDCEAMLLRSWEEVACFHADLGCDNFCFSNNWVHDSAFGRGVQFYGTNGLIANNAFARIGRTPIFIHYASGLVTGNSMCNCVDVHIDGIAVYDGCHDVVVANNYVQNIGFLLTLSAATNVTIYNNYFDAAGIEQKVEEWGTSCGGTIAFYNNTIVNNPCRNMLVVGNNPVSGSPNATYLSYNNIIAGGWSGYQTNRGYNIYVSLMWNQDPKDSGFYYGVGESTNTMAAVFVNPAAGDWRIKSGGPASGAGTNLSGVLNGVSRTTWDIGASSYSVRAAEWSEAR